MYSEDRVVIKPFTMRLSKYLSTNSYSKFDDTNKLTSNLIIVTVHAYLNEIFKVIKNGTKNEIK